MATTTISVVHAVPPRTGTSRPGDAVLHLARSDGRAEVGTP